MGNQQSRLTGEHAGGVAQELVVYSSAEEPRKPQDIFPDEMWFEIFQWLDNPRDLLHTGESSVFFQDLLERGSPIVPAAGRNVCQLVEVLPLVLKWLGKGDILNLRGVCRRVSNTVDQVLENSARISPYETLDMFPWLVPPIPKESSQRLTFESRNIKMPLLIRPCVVIGSIEKIDRLAVELEDGKWKAEQGTGRRPRIVGKRVRLEWGVEENPLHNRYNEQVDIVVTEYEGNLCPLLWEKIGEDLEDRMVRSETPREESRGRPRPRLDHGEDENAGGQLREIQEDVVRRRDRITGQRAFSKRCIQFFEQFPEKIEFLEVALASASDSLIEMYNFLLQIISTLPKLRRLELRLVEGELTRNPEGMWGEVMQLTTLLNYSPLPPSPNLEAISIMWFSWPEVFLRELSERYGHQLKDLSVEISAQQDSEGERYSFPVLQHLDLHIEKDSEGFPILFALDVPNLKSLRCSNAPEFFTPGLGRLISIFIQFPQIDSLTLDFCRNDIYWKPSFVLKYLQRDGIIHKNLRRLSLIVNQEAFHIPLRFFTRLSPNLESIAMEDYAEPEAVTSNVDLAMMRTQSMSKWRIWKEAVNLQRLKHVRIVDAGTRRVYECTKEKYIPLPLKDRIMSSDILLKFIVYVFCQFIFNMVDSLKKKYPPP